MAKQARIKLTERRARATPVDPTRDTFLRDAETLGLALRTTRHGARSWIVEYRTATGRNRRMTLGRIEALTLDQARALAKARLADVAAGRDPAGELHAARVAPTVADHCQWYLSEYCTGRSPYQRRVKKAKAPASIRNDRQMIADHIIPAIGTRKLDDVEDTDMQRIHDGMRATPYAANRVMALCSVLFDLAAKRRLTTKPNPAKAISRHEEVKRKRYLSDDELVRLGAALRAAAPAGESLFAVAAIRLLLFTGCRLNEILAARWEHVDLQSGVLHLPSAKTGARDVVLSGPARELLSGLPREVGNPHVIPGKAQGSHLVNLSKPWRRIREAAGIHDVRLHDLRHTFGSRGAGAGLSLPIIGALLGHSQPQTTARYSHVDLDPRRIAADRIAGPIAATLDGREPAEVVDIRGRR